MTLQTLGAIFFKSNHVGHYFPQIFKDSVKVFTDFAQMSTVLLGFSGIFSGVSPNQNFWGCVCTPAPVAPTPLLWTSFTATKTAAEIFVLSKFFRLLVNFIWPFLCMSTSTALARSKFQSSACRQLTSPKSNKKDQSTYNMNMSDYSCGAIKLTHGPNERIKTDGFP